jgi:shikimate kinase
MNLRYIDTDHFIENRYHKKISEIFAAEGEARFRDIEHRVLLEVSEFEDVVISTGGGLPCFNDNMTIMNNTGITIYLDVPVEELAVRLGLSKSERPVLKKRTGSELIEFIKDNLNIRKQFYEQSKIRFQAGQINSKNHIESMAKELESMLFQ